VADQTLEDFALRFTARSGRRMSIERVGKTALGATAFLALEGIAAAVTLNATRKSGATGWTAPWAV